MGNFEIELNKNNSPVVSATELELEYLRSNMGMSNIEEVRSRLKEFGLLAYFLARNFYDRDGKLDELKLTNWIKNSFRKLNYYVGESTTTFSFDDTNLTNEYLTSSFELALKLIKNKFIDKLINGPINKKSFLNKKLTKIVKAR